MPRQARAVIARRANHVTQRGNGRPDAFFTGEDRQAYPGYLRDAANHLALHGLFSVKEHRQARTLFRSAAAPRPTGARANDATNASFSRTLTTHKEDTSWSSPLAF